MRLIAIAGIACMLIMSCKNNSEEALKIGILEGTKWKLLTWSVSSSSPSPFTITADFSLSQISGTSAVNWYGGSYTANTDGHFSVSDLSYTKMAGSEEAMRAEMIYFELLRQARKFSKSGTTLTLMNESNQGLLIFNAR